MTDQGGGRRSRSQSPAQPAGRAAVEVEPLFDDGELPFDVGDVDTKIYVMRGSEAQICLEWQDLDAAVFRKKQGYGNAKKFTRKRGGETTVAFMNRAVQFQKATANPEGATGDFYNVVHNHKLLRATVYFTLLVIFVQLIMFVIYYVYDAAGCNIWYNLWTPLCSVLDKTNQGLPA